MSRYNISSASGLEINVGWDNPLQSFFAQVIQTETQVEFLWVGCKPGEIVCLLALEEKLNHYGPIPEEIKFKLQRDYNNRREPSRLQKLFGSLLAGEDSSAKNISQTIYDEL